MGGGRGEGGGGKTLPISLEAPWGRFRFRFRGGLGLGLVGNGVCKSVAWGSVACREGRLGGAYLRRRGGWGEV